MKKLAFSVVLAVLGAACGGSVDGGPGAGGGGAGGGAGGAGGGAGGGGGSAPEGCPWAHGTLSIEIAPFQGDPPSCDVMDEMPVVWTATGAVVQVDAQSLVIDECPADGNCAPMLTTVTVQGNDLALSVPLGAFVKVTHTQIRAFYGCTDSVIIENVPSFGGLTNPASTEDRVYLAGADGEIASFDGVPFDVGRVLLDCPESAEPGCGYYEPGLYGLQAGSTLVLMGETTTIDAGGRSFAFRNLRSYQTSACDAYWDWAYWIVEQ